MDRDVFKRGFYRGRMIWIRGIGREEGLREVQELLGHCAVAPEQIAWLSAEDFLRSVGEGEDRTAWFRFEAVVVRDLDHLGAARVSAFLRSLAEFRAISVGVGVRLILVTRAGVGDLFAPLLDHVPVVIEADGPASDPEDLNSTAQVLIESASALARVSIRRISARAACFLEQALEGGEERELLALLVEALRRSDGQVLRFRDILPQFRHYFGDEDVEEPPCG